MVRHRAASVRPGESERLRDTEQSKVLQTPVVRPNLRIQVVPGEGACLIDELGIRVYGDRRYELVLPLVDGKSSPDEIVDRLHGVMSAAEVYFTLMHLSDSGYIVESGDFAERTASNECALLSDDPVGFRANVSRVVVLMDNLTRYDGLGRRFASALADAGLHVGTELRESSESGTTLRVALVDDYLSPGVERYHRDRRSDGVDWLLVKPVGVTAWVGPLFSKHQGACWDCLASRLRINRVAETHLSQRLNRSARPPIHLLGSVEDVAKSLLVAFVVNDYAQQQIADDSWFVEYDLRRAVLDRHPVVPIDNCDVCLESRNAPAEQEVVLRSRPKVYTSDGGYRSVHPTDTLELERRLVSNHTGLVASLFPHKNAGPLMPVYLARHNYGYVPSSLSSHATNLANTSAGKGRTVAQARASALCEAVERHSVFFQGYETTVPGALAAMGDEAIHPNDCMLYSDRQYADRLEWNRLNAWSLRIPDPLRVEQTIDWSPVWSLTEKRRKYLPTTYLYHTPHLSTPPRGRRYCFSDSNGNSAGNNLDEAILQGFLELVERDAVAIWWYNQIPRPVVNLDELDDPYIASLLEAYGALGRRVWVLDLTHDFEIPVYVALSSNRDGTRNEILTGFGAHLAPRIAISRALTELNQMLPRARGDSDGRRKLDEETEVWFREVSLETAPFLSGITDTSTRIPRTVGPDTEDLVDDIRYCQSLVEKLGMEFLVLDQTRAEAGLSAVKVIVPGMRHYWRRLGPGRLYQVPVRLGWLESAKREEDLNPLSLLG